MSKKRLVLGALVFAIVTAATFVYAASALQLYAGAGVSYIKHVNFSTNSSAQTTLLLKKLDGAGNVQIKISARAVDGPTLTQSRTISLRDGETRSLVFVWSKPITDLNFIQLIATRTRDHGSNP